jgi:hypothetical protein
MLIDVAKPLQYIVGIITLFVRNLHFPGFLKHERVEAVASKIAPAAWLTTATIPLLFGGSVDAEPGMWITAVWERSERTTQGYRRFRCRCGKQCNERCTG